MKSRGLAQGLAIGRGRVRIAGEFHALTTTTATEDGPDLGLMRRLTAAALVLLLLCGLFYVAHVTSLDAGIVRLLDVRRLWDAAGQPPLAPCE